ncbi:MAG TPA: PKD domain-containing protein [Bacteroidia bacterium]
MKQFYKLMVLVAAISFTSTSLQAQCSASTTITDNGNGLFDFNTQAIGDPGLSSSAYIQFGDGTAFFDTTANASGSHQYYANGMFIITTTASFYDMNAMDSTGYCTATDVDTIYVVNAPPPIVPCSVHVYVTRQQGATDSDINFIPSVSSTFPVYQADWSMRDALGNLILTNNSSSVDTLSYSFTQGGWYDLNYYVAAYDSSTSTSCADSFALHFFVQDPACNMQMSMQQHNLPNNVVSLKGYSSIGYTSCYFLIEGNYFPNTDSVAYAFSSSGFHTVKFYAEYISATMICKDSMIVAIPVGGSPGSSCHAAFDLWEDSTNAGSWYAVNNSSGFIQSCTWDFGDGTTSSQMYPTHTYAVPGNYLICLTVGDNYGCSNSTCDSTSRITQQMSTNGVISTLTVVAPSVGIAENKTVLAETTLFPNPMEETTVITFNSSLAAYGKIEIVNILGSKVMQENVSITKGNNEIKLDTGSLVNGVYYVKIIAESRVLQTVKAVK